MAGKVISFGYDRRAMPPKADLTIDVRHLGHDMEAPEVAELVNKVVKDYVDGQTVCIGCQYGKHRSVEIANQIASKLKLRTQHRDR